MYRRNQAPLLGFNGFTSPNNLFPATRPLFPGGPEAFNPGSIYAFSKCSLSLVMFALYIVTLVHQLHNTKLEVKVGREIVTVLFLEDDLFLLSRTPTMDMMHLLRLLSSFYRSYVYCDELEVDHEQG